MATGLNPGPMSSKRQLNSKPTAITGGETAAS
jgi:hypothetical protein